MFVFGFPLNPYVLMVLLSISFNKLPCSSVSLSSGANGCSLKPVMLDSIRKVASDLSKGKCILRIFFISSEWIKDITIFPLLLITSWLDLAKGQ